MNYSLQDMAQQQALGLLGAQQTQTSPPSLGSMVAGFDDQLERLGKVASALLLLSDKIHGSEPRPADAPDPINSKVPSAGLINDLRRRHERLSRLLDTCEGHLARIERGL